MLEGIAQFLGEVVCVFLGYFVLRILTAGRWKSNEKGGRFVEGVVGGLVLLLGMIVLAAGCLLFMVIFRPAL